MIGILVQAATNLDDSSKLAELGYGMAVPTKYFMQLLKGEGNLHPPIMDMPFENLEDGGFKTMGI